MTKKTLLQKIHATVPLITTFSSIRLLYLDYEIPLSKYRALGNRYIILDPASGQQLIKTKIAKPRPLTAPAAQKMLATGWTMVGTVPEMFSAVST